MAATIRYARCRSGVRGDDSESFLGWKDGASASDPCNLRDKILL